MPIWAQIRLFVSEIRMIIIPEESRLKNLKIYFLKKITIIKHQFDSDFKYFEAWGMSGCMDYFYMCTSIDVWKNKIIHTQIMC